jgi:probable F420-dependent oxidoreductase
VKIGVCSANSGPYTTRETLAELARLAEASGIESMWVSEHPLVPDPREPPAPMNPEDPILDPIVALAFLASRTESVRLGSAVVLLPLRNPLILAKALASVDVLSSGRLILGIGVGYVHQEFDALGVPFAGRGERAEEYLAAIRAIWADEHPAVDGEFVSFTGVQARPRPLQRPTPPVVMGGYAPVVMRRTIREANGWYGWGLDLEATARRLDVLRETAARVERRPTLGHLEITITPPGDIDRETARKYKDLGVHRLSLQLPWRLAGDELDRYFADVISPLVDEEAEE